MTGTNNSNRRRMVIKGFDDDVNTDADGWIVLENMVKAADKTHILDDILVK